MMTDYDNLPWLTPGDVTPEMAALCRRILSQADCDQLTLNFLERALVAYTRDAVKKRP